MLLDDVIVVEQPFAGRSDIGSLVGRGRQARVRAFEETAGSVEPGQKRGAAAGLRGGQSLAPGDFAGALGQVLRPQELAVDRAGEEVLACLGTS
jgi:hypothetical protein